MISVLLVSIPFANQKSLSLSMKAAGISIVFNASQFLNASFPILFNFDPSAKLTLSNDLQFENAKLSILSTLAGISIVSNASQL